MLWVKVLNKGQIPPPDSVKKITAEGKQICIVNENDKIYATQARCPHAGGHLEEGWCKDGQLVCPVHRYSFDLETGRGAEGQGDYIDVYPTELRDDGLYVGFKESWWSKLWS